MSPNRFNAFRPSEPPVNIAALAVAVPLPVPPPIPLIMYPPTGWPPVEVGEITVLVLPLTTTTVGLPPGNDPAGRLALLP